MTGHLRLSRNILDWEWYDDPITKVVFLHLLLSANYEEKRYHGQIIKRGDVVTGRKELAEKLQLSERNIRTALEHLKATNEVTIKTTNKFSIITICKFEYWQDYPLQNDQQSDQQSDQQPTSNRPATDQQPTTPKEIKKEKNIEGNKDITPSSVQSKKEEVMQQFEIWWELYDKKVERSKVEAKWKKLTDDERRRAIEHTPKYVSATPDKQYRKNPQTYINNKCWDDEIIDKPTNVCDVNYGVVRYEDDPDRYKRMRKW